MDGRVETYPPDPVQRQRTVDLITQFGIDVESPSGRALVQDATDGTPLELPTPPPSPAHTPHDDTAATASRPPAPDVASATVQRAALHQPPETRPSNPNWVET